MKKVLKILGAAALVAGFAPYHFEKDEETGTQKVQALLWSVTRGPENDEGKAEIAFDFGLQPPFRKSVEEEAQLFSDELTVNYGGEAATLEDEMPVEEEIPEEPEAPEETEDPEEPESTEEPEDPEETEAPEEPETPEEPEADKEA